MRKFTNRNKLRRTPRRRQSRSAVGREDAARVSASGVIIADITSLLPQLSEDGLRRVQAEVNIALSVQSGKGN